MAGVQPSDAEVSAAVRVRATSTAIPSARAASPRRIRSAPCRAAAHWGLEPTARDQAAIDAGNA